MTEVVAASMEDVTQVEAASTGISLGLLTSENKIASSESLPTAKSSPKSERAVTTVTLFDDIFDTSSDTSVAPVERPLSQGHDEPPRPTLPSSGDVSDVPRLRSIHVTAGYRDGIADGKTRSVQSGFDEGYSLGAVMGLNVGWILGTLEGLIVMMAAKKREKIKVWKGRNAQQLANSKVDTTAGHLANLSVEDKNLRFSPENPPECQNEIQTVPLTNKSETDEYGYDISQLRALQREAVKSLSAANLFGSEFFGDDGIWLYDVPFASEAGDGLDIGGFEEVTSAHPRIKAWKEAVLQWAERLEIDVDVIEQIQN